MKIFFHGKRLKESKRVRAGKRGWRTRKRREFFIRLHKYARRFALCLVVVGAWFALNYHAEMTLLDEFPIHFIRGVQATEEVEVPAILEKIAKCESGGEHYIDGEIVRGHITPTDIGKYQISLPHWDATARELGLDVYTEEDNEKFAMWLYEKYGTSPWFLSADCWQS